jgi:uncharacterized membrane protein
LRQETEIIKDKTGIRLASIDLVRGVVMIIMALDHVRTYMHSEYWKYDASDLERTSAAIFMTRWITHFCAPSFIFLAGISIWLQKARVQSIGHLSLFLASRGMVLLLLELTVIRFGALFEWNYTFIPLQIIWTIGLCMIFMAAIVLMPYRIILFVALTVLCFHNLLLGGLDLDKDHSLYKLWVFLYHPATVKIFNTRVFVANPSLGWLALMMIGYCVGHLYTGDPSSHERRKILYRTGFILVVLFIVCRMINLYGDPQPWIIQSDPLFTVLSFLKTTKNPPSLLYILMTMGPALILLAAAEEGHFFLKSKIIVFGRVALFYYIIHIYFIHLCALLLVIVVHGQSPDDLVFGYSGKTFGGIPKESGGSLCLVYGFWLLTILALYPLCKWYSDYKRKFKYMWLRYF